MSRRPFPRLTAAEVPGFAAYIAAQGLLLSDHMTAYGVNVPLGPYEAAMIMADVCCERAEDIGIDDQSKFRAIVAKVVAANVH